MSFPRPQIFLSSLLLFAGACAAEGEALDTGGDERSDTQSTSKLEGTYCHTAGSSLRNFKFELIEMSFDGGSQGRKDTGTATLVGKLVCDRTEPAVPCTRTIVTADYNASWSYLQFTPTSMAEYDQSTGEISDQPLRTEPYKLAWILEQDPERLHFRKDSEDYYYESFEKVASWGAPSCDPEVSELGL